MVCNKKKKAFIVLKNWKKKHLYTCQETDFLHNEKGIKNLSAGDEKKFLCGGRETK